MDEHYDLYKHLHHDFSQNYVNTGKFVMDFYPAWKSFVDKEGPEIGKLVNAFTAGEGSAELHHGFEMLFYFLKDFKDDASIAQQIMSEYNALCGQSNTYMRKVFMLQERNEADKEGKLYEHLIPELHHLIIGFRDVEEKTRQAMENLQQMQAEWSKIRERISVM
jgi:hypothetical protein